MTTKRFAKLGHIDHVLVRPDMYTGANATQVRDEYVVDETGNMVRRPTAVNNILLKIFDELLVNARDHSVRDPTVSLIKVTIDETSFSVWNDGSTLPLIKDETEGVYVPELVFAHLLTGSNFDDDQDRIVGGRNGLGAKLANIWAHRFEVHLCDGKTVYMQTCKNNMKNIGTPRLREATGPAAGKVFTKLTVFPDFARLGVEDGTISQDMKRLMQRRVFDIAATTRPIVKLGTKRVPCSSVEAYAKMVAPRGTPVVHFHSERWDVSVWTHTADGPPPRLGFVNGISTNQGTHMAHVLAQVVKHVRAAVKKYTLTPAMVSESLGLIVNATIVRPEFTNQQKDTLTTPAKKWGSTCTLPEEVLKKVVTKKMGLIDRLETLATTKMDAVTKRNDAKRTRLAIPKLDDAVWAGTHRSGECTLILCEGDSAKSLAIAGLSSIDGRKRFGVFPLRGKLVNVRENAAASQKNQEIQFLKRILGLEHKKVYTSTKDLRYGRILIMTDADADGSHIKGLLLNYIDAEFPGLLGTPGFVAEFVTPLMKVTKGTVTKSFFSMQEYDAWRATDADPAAWTVKYYKGLGTSTSKEARDYFAALDRHVITFTDDPARGESLSLAFSKKRANDRKSWVLDHDGSGRDYDVDRVSISDFVNKDLINFSVADVTRSIPSSIDGLKPSQRKVLYGAFKKKLDKDMKVAQLSGYVSEQSAYHHGEASLQGTIVGLARDFPGSNNVNLLVPSGQFGSRLVGGSDAASARYIFTRLAPWTRAIFPARDDPVLESMVDDGMRIEPRFYVPIVPLVLINGAAGIGTGFSTSIPNHAARDVLSAVRARLRGSMTHGPLPPSYRGLTGSIVPCEGGYMARGAFEVRRGLRGTSVQITDLPPGTWTSQYKEWLLSVDSVSRLVDESTETTVRLEFTCSDPGMLTWSGLRLETKLSTTNMTLINGQGTPQKYDSVDAIIEEHHTVRYGVYERRKAHELQVLETSIREDSNKLRFVRCVVDGTLAITNRALATVETEMRALGIRQDPKLLAMPLRSLTREKVDSLVAHVDHLRAEKRALETMTVEEMWTADLDHLESLLPA